MKTLAGRHDNKCGNIFKMKKKFYLIDPIPLTPCMLAKTGKDTEREDRLRWRIGREEVAITAVLADMRKRSRRCLSPASSFLLLFSHGRNKIYNYKLMIGIMINPSLFCHRFPGQIFFVKQ
jgi:hypothetical protein